MGIAIKIGESVPIGILLDDRATDKFVRAIIRNEAGTPFAASPVNVPHLANGYHESTAVAMINTLKGTVEYDVFDDALFTTLSDHLPDIERFELKAAVTTTDSGAASSITGKVSGTGNLAGKVESEVELKGSVGNSNITGKIDSDDDSLSGSVDNTNLKGEI